VISKFTDYNMSQESLGWKSFVDRKGRQFGSGNSLTAFLAGVFESDMLADEEARGDEVELLGDGFPDGLLNAATAGQVRSCSGSVCSMRTRGRFLEGVYVRGRWAASSFPQDQAGRRESQRGFPQEGFALGCAGTRRDLAARIQRAARTWARNGAQELFEAVLQRLILGREFQDHLVQQFDVSWEHGWVDRRHAEYNDSSLPA